jgi:hypothetical protein
MSESQSVSRSRRVTRSTACSGTATLPPTPRLVIAVVNAASSDWAASRLAAAIERVAEALLVEEEAQRIVPARELLRARP